MRRIVALACALLLSTACGAGTPPWSSRPATPRITDSHAPAQPADALLRPRFSTTEGTVAAGSAFLVRWQDGVLLLTAQHLFHGHVVGPGMPTLLRAVDAGTADGDGVRVRAARALLLRTAVPSSIAVHRDLVAVQVDYPGPVHVLTLAAAVPRRGQRVYLLGQPADGGAPRLYRAAVDRPRTGQAYLRIVYDRDSGMTNARMSGMSGSPVLDVRGQVVGMLEIGGDRRDGRVWTGANPVTSIRTMLTGARPGARPAHHDAG